MILGVQKFKNIPTVLASLAVGQRGVDAFGDTATEAQMKQSKTGADCTCGMVPGAQRCRRGERLCLIDVADQCTVEKQPDLSRSALDSHPGVLHNR